MNISLESNYRLVEPDATFEGTVGDYRLWRDATVTPQHRFDSVLAIHPTHALSFRTRDGFDLDAVLAVLSHVTPLDPSVLPRSGLFVRPDLFLNGRGFTTAVVVPPNIGRLFEPESSALNRFSWWVLPAYRCEFVSGDDAHTFWFAIRSGGIEVIDWSRTPTPLVRAQLLSPWHGGMLRSTKEPFLLNYATLEYILPALPVTVRGLQLFGVLGTVLVRRQTARVFTLTFSSPSQQDTSVTVPLNGVVSTVQSILLGSGEAATGGA